MNYLTAGTFDIPHYGHFKLIDRIAKLMKPEDNLYISINKDDFVERFKNKKVVMTLDERKKTLEVIVANYNRIHVVTNDYDENLIGMIEKYHVNTLIIGNDWLVKDYLKQINTTVEYLNKNDISILFVPYTNGISTTEIKRRINASS